MEKGEMTKADELLVIDILSNLRAERDAARTPQGQLASMQLASLKKQGTSRETAAKIVAGSPTQPGQGTRGQTMDRAKKEMGKGKLTLEGFESVMETAPAGVNIIEEGGQQVLMVDGQFKAIIPKAKPGMARIDTIKIPGTNKVQPVQYDENGKVTPMGAAIEKSSDEIDREFKVDVLGDKAYAFNKQRADSLRQQVSDIEFANDSITTLLNLSKLTGEEAKLEARGKAKSLTATMIGRLRVTLMGPGVLSNQDTERVIAAIPDPTKILAFDTQEIAALTQTLDSLRSGLVRDINTHIEGGSKNITLPDWLKDAQSGGGGLSANPDFSRGPGGKLTPEKR
jgi:hypothetical protein